MLTGSSKRVAQRRCVGCRRSGDKKEFMRIVRRSDGHVAVDVTGREPGRGAYLCRRRSCWQAALRRDGLGRALRTRLQSDDRESLLQFVEGTDWTG